MKTKVRITVKNDGYYKHFIIDVLNSRYSNYYEIAGSIMFQSDKSRFSNPEVTRKWYALNFKIESDRLEHFEYFIKVIRYIDKNTYYDVQPEELLSVIGAEEYVIHFHEFVPLSYNNMNLYDIIDVNSKDKNNVWTRIYCANNIIAKQETERLSEKNKTTYEFKLKEENIQLQSNMDIAII